MRRGYFVGTYRAASFGVVWLVGPFPTREAAEPFVNPARKFARDVWKAKDTDSVSVYHLETDEPLIGRFNSELWARTEWEG